MKVQTVFTVILGTILEWYDFALYAAFSSILSVLFFPNETQYIGLLKTFLVFAIGYLVRPVGAVFFGWFGDRYGRKKALHYAIIMMTVPTVLIGLLPSYKEIGFFAPLALGLCRILQGLSVSGEYPAATVFLFETYSNNGQGWITSFSLFGVAGGMLLGSSFALIFHFLFSYQELILWGWRIPFLFSAILGWIGIRIRKKLNETTQYTRLLTEKNVPKQPIRYTIKHNFGKIAIVVGLFWFNIVSFYTIFTFVPTYLVVHNHILSGSILPINASALLLLLIFIPIFSRIAIKNCLKTFMAIAALITLITSLPLFLYYSTNNIAVICSIQMIFAILIAAYVAPLPFFVSTLFPTEVRMSGMSLALNLGASILGGTAPLINTLIVHQYKSIIAASFYLILSACISLLTLIMVRYSNIVVSEN